MRAALPGTPQVLPPELVSYEGYEPGTLIFDHPLPPTGQRVRVLRRTPSAASAGSEPPPGATAGVGGLFESSCCGEGSMSRASAVSQRMLIARKIRPGQTIALGDSPGAAASFPPLLEPHSEAEAVLSSQAGGRGLAGPRRLAEGEVVSHSVLGRLSDFYAAEAHHAIVDRARGGAARSPPPPPPPPPLAHSSRMRPGVSGDALTPVRRASLASPSQLALVQPFKPAEPAAAADGGSFRAGERGGERGAVEWFSLAEEAERDSADEARARIVEQHERVEGDWRSQKRALSAHTGRPLSELVMSRADSFRLAAEEARVVERHRPLEDVYPNGADFAHRLRDANVHYLPVGSSGLFTAARRAPQPALARAHPDLARRQAQRRESAGVWGGGGSESDEAVSPARSTRAHSRPLPSPGGTGNGGGGGGGGGPRTPHQPPLTAGASAEVAVAYFEQSRLVEGSAVPLDMAASRPAVSLEPARLLLEAAPGEPAVAAYAHVFNSGTTAVSFCWRPQRAGPAAVAALDGVGAGADGHVRFFSNAMSGVLLPGQRRALPLSFASPSAGAFAERWLLETVPPLPAGAAQPTIELRALCAERDRLGSQRDALRARLSRSELVAFARALVLKEIVGPAVELAAVLSAARGQRSLFGPRPPGLPAEAVGAAFERANRAERLVFEPRAFARLQALAARAYGEGGDGRWDLSVATLEERLALATDAADSDAHLCLDELGAIACALAIPRRADEAAAARRADRRGVIWRALAAAAEAAVGAADDARAAHGLAVLPLVLPDALDGVGAPPAAESQEDADAAGAEGADAAAATAPAGGVADGDGGANPRADAGDAAAADAEVDADADADAIAGGSAFAALGRGSREEQAAAEALFSQLQVRAATLDALAAELAALAAAKPSAVRKALLARKADGKGSAEANKASLLALLLAEQAALSAAQQADSLELYPPAPPPRAGKLMRRAGELWRWDWQQLEYATTPDDDDADAAPRPPEPCVEAAMRRLVVEMADAVGRMLEDADATHDA